MFLQKTLRESHPCLGRKKERKEKIGPDNRYFDWDGQVHLAKGKTGGQQGDPLEMLIFNLTIHHLWGRVLAKFQGARAIAYADDGYIKGKLSVALQVLSELKTVFKADAGLELNVNKTSILPKHTTAQSTFDMAQTIM